MKDLQRKLNRAENEISLNSNLKEMQANRFQNENVETQVGINFIYRCCNIEGKEKG